MPRSDESEKSESPESPESPDTPKTPDAGALLLADLEHFGEAMHRNEETGEKRLSFFLALLTAVTTGLVALSSTQSGVPEELQPRIRVGAVLALLAVGILTYLRMLKRNDVTDQHKCTLGYIRARYAEMAGLADYRVPQRADLRHGRIHAGYAEMMAVLDGGLVIVLLLLIGGDALPAIVGGAVVGFTLAEHARARRGGGREKPVVRQAGAIAYRDLPERQYLLVTSRRSPDEWIFPKGHVEEGETDEQAALRELREEAGVSGVDQGEAGTLRFSADGENLKVHYRLVRADSEGEDREKRSRTWLPFDRAFDALAFDDARVLLYKAHRGRR